MGRRRKVKKRTKKLVKPTKTQVAEFEKLTKNDSKVPLINHYVWYLRVCPKDFIMEVSDEDFSFSEDSVVVNAKDEMVNTISKSMTPRRFLLKHPDDSVLRECVDWIIKYCEIFGILLPEFECTNAITYDRLDDYRKMQIKKNKRRRKKKLYN